MHYFSFVIFHLICCEIVFYWVFIYKSFICTAVSFNLQNCRNKDPISLNYYHLKKTTCDWVMKKIELSIFQINEFKYCDNSDKVVQNFIWSNTLFE